MFISEGNKVVGGLGEPESLALGCSQYGQLGGVRESQTCIVASEGLLWGPRVGNPKKIVDK